MMGWREFRLRLTGRWFCLEDFRRPEDETWTPAMEHVNEVLARKGGGVCYVGPGTYELDQVTKANGPFVVGDNVTFCGSRGADSVLTKKGEKTINAALKAREEQ